MNTNIEPTKIADGGITKLIERLARDCGLKQYIREYLCNSLEAIKRTSKKGEVHFDVEWNIYEEQGLYKLSITDNGEGMTGDEMVKLVKDLTSSGPANDYENYGMGAKISSLTRNKAGIVYQSWKHGKGAKVILGYDAKDKIYGCFRSQDKDGNFKAWSSIDDKLKPYFIKNHGTKVIFYGNSPDDDTMKKPEGVDLTKESWIYSFINERFWETTKDVKITVRIGYERARSDTQHNYLLSPKGQKSIFEKVKDHSGAIKLKGATVHWYILKDSRSRQGRDNVSGITALMHQSELFDIANNKNSRRINQFGIIMGAENIALIIEPEGKYSQNIQRTSLSRSDGNPMPWDQWAEEFKLNIPKKIDKYVKDLMLKSSKDSHTDSISERLKKFVKFYKVSRYKLNKRGSIHAAPDSLVPGTEGGKFPNVLNPTPTDQGLIPPKPIQLPDPNKKPTGKGCQNIEDIYAAKFKDGGTQASSIIQNPFPKVRWVSILEKTRSEGDVLEDRAATYVEVANLIKANKDFRGIQDIIEHFMDKYKKIDEAAILIPDTVYEYFEQQLMESVAGALSLRNRKHWNNENMKTLLSPEALTACSMQRVHIVTEINKSLKNKLGKIN